MERLLRSKAVLLPGVKVMLDVEQADGTHAGEDLALSGRPGRLSDANWPAARKPVAPIYAAEKYAGGDDESFAEGEGAAWALGWYAGGGGLRVLRQSDSHRRRRHPRIRPAQPASSRR